VNTKPLGVILLEIVFICGYIELPMKLKKVITIILSGIIEKLYPKPQFRRRDLFTVRDIIFRMA
jgi:hypothetical protein